MKIIINQIDITDYQVSINSTLILKSINHYKACNNFMVFPELALTGFPTKDNVEYLWDESEEHFQNILLASKNTELC